MDEDVREIVEAELRDGEELLWAERCQLGRPDWFKLISFFVLMIILIYALFDWNIQFLENFVAPLKFFLGVSNGQIYFFHPVQLLVYFMIIYMGFYYLKAAFIDRKRYFALTRERLIVFDRMFKGDKFSFDLLAIKEIKKRPLIDVMKHQVSFWYVRKQLIGKVPIAMGASLFCLRGLKNRDQFLKIFNEVKKGSQS